MLPIELIHVPMHTGFIPQPLSETCGGRQCIMRLESWQFRDIVTATRHRAKLKFHIIHLPPIPYLCTVARSAAGRGGTWDLALGFTTNIMANFT